MASAPDDKFGWEHGPMKLITTPVSRTGATDQYTFAASEMALVHNCIIRGFNSIYNQTPHIQPSDYKSFVAYCYACFEALETHHRGEEAHFFPDLEAATGKKGIMEVNVQQHEAFHNGLEAWGAWLKELNETDTSKFSAAKCIELMDSFITSLSQHLADEIPTILSLSEYGNALDLRAMFQREGDQVMKTLSTTKQMPVFLLNHDVTYEGGIHNFPPIPAPVKFVLMQVCARWNRDWWKFATCGYDGKPKSLYAARS
jgi:hemerythrin-like domain-containing protein